MKIATIDIGTNTILLLISELDKQGNLTVLHHEQRIPRIGKSVDENRNIQQSAFKIAAQILLEYKQIANRYEVDNIVACATSAVRDSQNKQQFIESLLEKTGINIEILSGDDEAILTYKGAVSGLPESNLPYLVLDIGGGSAEISFAKSPNDKSKGTELIHKSFDVGSVRITERFFRRDPPLVIEMIGAKMFIDNQFQVLKDTLPQQFELVGVAGTVTTLACLEQRMANYNVDKIRGLKLSQSQVQKWKEKLLSYYSGEILSLSNAAEGREDILAAGVLILSEFMFISQSKSVIVSERGLRYGLALREWERMK